MQRYSICTHAGTFGCRGTLPMQMRTSRGTHMSSCETRLLLPHNISSIKQSRELPCDHAPRWQMQAT